MNITEKEQLAIGHTTQTLLTHIFQLCQHIAEKADEDEQPPLCFMEAFATLQHFNTASKTYDVVQKAMKK